MPGLTAAIDSYPDQFTRSRLFCVARLASLTLQQGDPDEGVALSRRALDGARGIRSMRVIDDIAEIHRSTARLQHTHPAVADLRIETA